MATIIPCRASAAYMTTNELRCHLIHCPPPDDSFEAVERKGRGHPDTLADGLAEHLSREYSVYTTERFGAVLHHNFDKLALLGGQAAVRFGSGVLRAPIRVLLNGRACEQFGTTTFPLRELLHDWTLAFLSKAVPTLRLPQDIIFQDNLSTAPSPGAVTSSKSARRSRWFSPATLLDLPDFSEPFANDTSMGVGYAPASALERLVLEIETTITSDSFHSHYPWCGFDVKVLGVRIGEEVSITACIPQIANSVRSAWEYEENLRTVRRLISELATKYFDTSPTSYLNTRDSDEHHEYYLTAVGTSLESGDEGVVGRGNRVNGLITTTRPMSIEAASGKNPVYHVGKLYNLLAQRIADEASQVSSSYVDVHVLAQSGSPLHRPAVVVLRTPSIALSQTLASQIVERHTRSLGDITRQLLLGRLKTS